MGLILLILVILFLFGGGGYYGYRSGYYGGRGFGGTLGVIVLIVILFWLFGGWISSSVRLLMVLLPAAIGGISRTAREFVDKE